MSDDLSRISELSSSAVAIQTRLTELTQRRKLRKIGEREYLFERQALLERLARVNAEKRELKEAVRLRKATAARVDEPKIAEFGRLETDEGPITAVDLVRPLFGVACWGYRQLGEQAAGENQATLDRASAYIFGGGLERERKMHGSQRLAEAEIERLRERCQQLERSAATSQAAASEAGEKARAARARVKELEDEVRILRRFEKAWNSSDPAVLLEGAET